MATPVLLTFAPMIDSECTRRILGHYRIAHEERDRLFGWVSALVLLHGGYGRVPLFYGPGFRMSGPRAVVARFDDEIPHRRLVPKEEPWKQRVEAEFALYNGDLAADVAALAYFHLLPAREAMIESFGLPITASGRRTLPYLYGPLRGLFSLLLRLRPARIADVALRVEGLLDFTDRKVADGRRFLVGAGPTLADFALMSAMAPIVLPPAYAPRVPDFAKLPAEFQALVAKTRKRSSGRFVAKLYRTLVPET